MRLSNRVYGLAMMLAGLAMALAGLAWWLTGDDVGGELTSTTEMLDAVTTSTTTTTPTTTTTTPTTTSTTVPATTTTTVDAGAAIGGFVPVFADAIVRRDIEYLLDTLHPSVFALFDRETCRAFISDEIFQLEQYRLIGEVDGPTAQLVADMEVDMYQAPVAFAFQGQEFTSEAAFAFADGEVRWFTQCGSG